MQWRFGGDETNVPNHLGDLTIWNLNATRAAHDFGAEPFKWWLSSDKWWKTMPPIIVGFHGAAVTFDESAEQVKYLESNGAAVEPAVALRSAAAPAVRVCPRMAQFFEIE